MTDQRKRPIEPLFHAARRRKPGAEREAYLDGACEGDAGLRARIEALLEADREASGFLEGPAVEGPKEGPGTSIGPYKLLQEIGEGGMGVVYMAEQEHPVRRKVALKVIKLGMDTKQVIARFEAERQALAMMDHQNIARVLDAGATETGRPYFVMELVRGVSIDTYCDTHKLSTEERLALFVEVCRAVQHAHQKGVIHRDLKPTNVLVTSHDGKPVPKIIDFGVAKATHQRLTERTLFTEFHQFIGTPEYMSPEQAEMSGLDVDTRSDIYALGVLLYQLLTGTTPADPKLLRTAGFEEMTRIIREDEPVAPSTRVSKLAASGETIALHRKSDAGALSRYFRGDIDWIVMKALEKDRTRRYETAAAFAEDVVRHLESRPVEAGPPGAGYRLAKFVRRNKSAVIAATVLAAVVGLGLAGTTAGFLSARRQAARSGRISDSLQDVLAMTDAARGADRAEAEAVLATVRDVFGEEHATYAAVLDTLARNLHDAGDFGGSAELSRDAIEVWERAYGERHPNVAGSLVRLGRSLHAMGEEGDAEGALRSAVEILEGSPNVPGSVGFEARVELASLLGNRGEYEEADALLGESLAALRASPYPNHLRIIDTLEQRVMLQISRPSGDARESVKEIYDETHAFYPDDSPALALTAMGYGRQLFQHGDPEAAEAYLREALERFRASPNPPTVYYFVTCDLLFQILRGREDPAGVALADELLGELIRLGQPFLEPKTLVNTGVFYARRMVDRGLWGRAFDAMIDAHRTAIEAEISFEDRESLRDALTKLAFDACARPELEAGVHAKALAAAEVALSEEPDHPAMLTAVGAGLYRTGEFERAIRTLDRLAAPLSEARGGLAARLAPGDLAFRALAYAGLGEAELARAELDALLEFADGRDAGALGREVVRAVEALTETTPSSNGDG